MRINKYLLLASVMACLNIPATGQNKRLVDSLENTLKTATGEKKVDVLNQLAYAFITNDNEKVIQYNNQAIQLSKKLEYLKGEAIAYTYKGVFETLSGQFPEAHRDLHRGLRLSKEAGDRVNEGYTLLQLGVCGLEEVENDSALSYFHDAYEIYKDSTNPVTLSKIYRNMSAAYGQRYDYENQQYYLSRSIAIRRLLPDKTLLTEALSLQANNALRSGDLLTAKTILNEAESIANDNPEFIESRNDFRHLKALLLFKEGKIEEAMVLVDSARDYYFKSSLLRKYVTLLIDISKIFFDRGEYELALNNLYPALQLSKLRSFDSETYVIRNLIGWINFSLEDYDQALRLANESLNNPTPQKQLRGDLADACTLKGVTLLLMNDFNGSKISLDSSFRIFKELRDQRGMSEALINLGYWNVRQNRYMAALPLYQESIALAQATHYEFGLAKSSWGLGEIYYRQGDFKSATRFLDQSEKYSRQIHANEVLISGFNTRRDLLAAQSRYKESLIYAIRAGKLKDSIHRTDLARRFVNLEKIQEIEQRDRDIKVLQQENQLAEDKINLQDARLRQQFILLIGGLIAGVLVTVLAFVYYRFYSRIKNLNITITEKNRSIQAQADQLKKANSELSQLYLEVSEQNEEIQMQSNNLTESNRYVSDLNRGLERIVAEKTLELRTTNEELVRYNNELLQFSYTVSHNLRGSVARLLGLSVVAKAEQELESMKKWIDLMNFTATDLDLIIKDLSKLLDLRNEPNQYREMVSFEKEWSQSLSLLQDSLTGEEQIISDFSACPQIITVRAMIQSIFYNLLSNAIKFRSPERKLKITARNQSLNGIVILEITDNGLGFDTNLHAEKIFKLYKRFHTHVQGRGLGLYLIKAQLEVLHGTIEVESKLNQGSLFRITIPLVESSE
jgi:signal transduction histidine kinase